MPLNGTGFAGYADRFARYAEGQQPALLTPVGGGTGIPFTHDSRRIEARETQAGTLDYQVLIAMVRTRLETAAQYTHDGETWTVESCEPDKMGGAAWPYRAVLVGHAR